MYLCIDVGSTKTLIATFSHRGKMLKSVKFLTPRDQSQFFPAILQQVHPTFDLKGLTKVALALPGPVKDHQPIFFGNLPWRPMDFQAKLTELFHVPAAVYNDAFASAYAETRRKGKGRQMFFTFSTGIGSAVMVNGKPDPEHPTFEPGHAHYTRNGRQLEWEDFASASAVMKDYGRFVTEVTDQKSLDDIAARIAIGLTPIIIQIKPTRIVLGGPLGMMLDLYRGRLISIIKPQLPPSIHMPKLVKAKYAEAVVVYGLYFLLRDN